MGTIKDVFLFASYSGNIFEQVELALEQIELDVVDLLKLRVEEFLQPPLFQFFIAGRIFSLFVTM